MNTTIAQPTTTVNQPALDEAWLVGLEARLEALPITLADVTDPYQVGWLDGEAGEISRPGHWYAKLTDIELYIIGWNDANHVAARESRRHPSFQQAIDDYRNGKPYGAFRHNYTSPAIKWYEIGWNEAKCEDIAQPRAHWQLVIATGIPQLDNLYAWPHFMPCDNYQDAVAALEGYKHNIIASGYQPSDTMIGCWERLGDDGRIYYRAACIINTDLEICDHGGQHGLS